MERKIVNTAAVPVTQKPVEKLTSDYAFRIAQFRSSLSVFQGMAAAGLLSQDEYCDMSHKLANKYGLSSCSIFL